MRVDLDVVINQPLGAVFAHFADVEGRPNWVTPALERRKVTDGPVAAGTRLRSTDRLPFGRVTFDHEVTALVPNELISETWTGPLGGRSDARFSAEGEATRVSLEMEMNPTGIYRVLAPLLSPWVHSAMRKDLRKFETWVASPGS